MLKTHKLIQKCIDANLSYFSISDHDTLNHIRPIKNFITQNNLNINFIPSTEITCNFNQSTIHVLGYGIEENSFSLSNIFSKMKQERKDVIERMGKKLNEMEQVDCPNDQNKFFWALPIL